MLRRLLSSRAEQTDYSAVRAAVKAVMDAPGFDTWLDVVPDNVLVAVAAPMEILQFHYYLEPPKDRHLARAARLTCEALAGKLTDCPDDMATLFRRLGEAVEPPIDRP